MPSQRIGNHTQLRYLLVIRQFVGFGRNNQPRDLQFLQPFRQLDIQFRRRHSRIDELYRQSKCRTILKISLDENLPLLDGRFVGFGIAEAWQIDEKVRSVYPIEINTLCFTRSGTGPGKFKITDQPIDKTRLADVRPSCKNYLGNP